MSQNENTEIDPFQTPNIFSPLDSPSLMNSMIDQNPLTQSLIEHKKIVEALERAILESNKEPNTELQHSDVVMEVENDGKLLEFLKENREILEPIIKEQYVELVTLIEDKKEESEPLVEKPQEESPPPTKSFTKQILTVVLGGLIGCGLVYAIRSYSKKKD